MISFTAACAFARLGDIKLKNVMFNGRIEGIGSDVQGKPARVEILDSPVGSKYILSDGYIGDLILGGSGTFVIDNCTITGQIKITGSPNVYIGFKTDFTDNSKFSSSLSDAGKETRIITEEDLGKPVIDGRGVSSGKFCLGRMIFENPENVEINFSETGIEKIYLGRYLIDANEFLGTGFGKVLEKIDLSNCSDLNTLWISCNLYVKTVNISGCTKINYNDYYPNTWKVVGTEKKEGLIMQSMGLSGRFFLNNSEICCIDISNNSITKLELNASLGSGKESKLKHVNASKNSITNASINMVTTGKGSTLDLSNNNLSGNTEKAWNIIRMEKDYTTTDINPNLGESNRQYSFVLNENGTTNDWIDCRTCGGDGTVAQAGGEKIIKVSLDQFAVEDTQLQNQYPEGWWEDTIYYETTSNGGYQYKKWHTGENDPDDTNVFCPVCRNYDGSDKYPGHKYKEPVTVRVGTLYVKELNDDVGLTINGNTIHTKFNAGDINPGNYYYEKGSNGSHVDDVTEFYMDFAAEWEGLDHIDVNLHNNGICYQAWMKRSNSYEKWTITFKINFKGVEDNDYVIIYDCDDNPETDKYSWWNGNYKWYGNLNIGSSYMSNYNDGTQMFSGYGELKSGSNWYPEWYGIPKESDSRPDDYYLNSANNHDTGYPIEEEGATNPDHRYQPFQMSTLKSRVLGLESMNNTFYVMSIRDVDRWKNHDYDNTEAARGPDILVYPFGSKNTEWPERGDVSTI